MNKAATELAFTVYSSLLWTITPCEGPNCCICEGLINNSGMKVTRYGSSCISQGGLNNHHHQQIPLNLQQSYSDSKYLLHKVSVSKVEFLASLSLSLWEKSSFEVVFSNLLTDSIKYQLILVNKATDLQNKQLGCYLIHYSL